eukprot:1673746-Rhodomonas_salina.4
MQVREFRGGRTRREEGVNVKAGGWREEAADESEEESVRIWSPPTPHPYPYHHFLHSLPCVSLGTRGMHHVPSFRISSVLVIPASTSTSLALSHRVVGRNLVSACGLSSAASSSCLMLGLASGSVGKMSFQRGNRPIWTTTHRNWRVLYLVVRSGRSYLSNSLHASMTKLQPIASSPSAASSLSCCLASSSIAASCCMSDSHSSHTMTRACVVCHPPFS